MTLLMFTIAVSGVRIVRERSIWAAACSFLSRNPCKRSYTLAVYRSRSRCQQIMHRNVAKFRGQFEPTQFRLEDEQDVDQHSAIRNRPAAWVVLAPRLR